jgi:hypothetical protein
VIPSSTAKKTSPTIDLLRTGGSVEGHDTATKDMTVEGDDPTSGEVWYGRVPALSKRLCGEYARCQNQKSNSHLYEDVRRGSFGATPCVCFRKI